MLLQHSEEGEVKGRLALAIIIMSLIAACGGGEGATPTPGASPVTSATRAFEATAPPTATPTATPSPPLPSAAVLTLPPAQATLGDTWTRPADGMTMVYVPGGAFQMGADEHDPDAVAGELPQHTVRLDGFWIDQTEVTNGQFVDFLNDHGNADLHGSKMIVLDHGYTRVSQSGDRFVTPDSAFHRPVVMVTWHGAAAYCEWAGGRLPTEAEWEYAARGPEGNLYPWGDAPPTCDLANYGTCSSVPSQVGSRPDGASWCGALDLAGNVWEWVGDWFGPYPDSVQENPTGPGSGEVPVLRGGGWHSPRWEVRTAYRQHELPKIGFNGCVGFRCVVTHLTGSPTSAPTATAMPRATDTPEPTCTPTPPPTDTPEPSNTPTAGSPSASQAFIRTGQKLGTARSWDVALGDVDSDGDLDALVANDGLDNQGSALWLNDGQGSFAASSQTLGSSWSVALGDVDGDGDLDALTTFDQSAEVWLNSGGTQAGTPGIYTHGGQSLDCHADCFLFALGDLDSDGDLDAFLGTRSANLLWLNDGAGLFRDSGQRLGDIFTIAASVGDLDGDGDQDVLSGGWQGAVETWINDGAGALTYLEQSQLGSWGHIHRLALGDLDGDGDLDAFATVASGDPSQVWFNDGSGLFVTKQRIPTSLTHDVSLGDIDGDGDLDALIAVGNMEVAGGSKALLNDGSGHLSRASFDMGRAFCSSVALGDLDGDGDLDAFVTHTHWLDNTPGKPNRVWLNQLP
jgi:formylglycine-generating enzyme required for sulfatase activity